MSSRNVNALLCAACIAGATGCSDDDPSTAGGALTPSAGAAGASGSAGLGGSAGAAAAGGSGASAGNTAAGSGGSRAGDSGGNAGSAATAGAGGQAGAAGAAGEAGAAGAAGATGAGAEPGLPDAGAEPPAEEPPPGEDEVGFSDVYGLLVTQCGGCHSGNPAFLPGFAQPDEAAASALVLPGGLADRIYARAVIDRTMPPACDGGDFGDPGCVSEEEAALLQAWADGGYQP